MNRTKRLWVGLGGSLAVIGLVAGVTLAIATLLGITFDQSQRRPPAAVQTASIGNDFRPKATRYPGFSFCVEAIGVDEALEAVAKARIETALLEVMQHPYWNIRERRASVPPLVDVGCPSEPLIARPGVDWDGPNFRARGNIGQYAVAEPSFYWTFIFVMPIDQLRQLLGDASIPHAPQEHRWDGAVLRLETTAIFVSPEQLEDTAFLVRELLIAVGLESAFPESEFPESDNR